MRWELPVCTRCCFCLPLRYGLIVWGYVRIVTAILLTMVISKLFLGLLGALKYEVNTYYVVWAVILVCILVVVLVDIVLNLVFIIGGHQKNLKLLRVYYIYSFAIWILLCLTGLAIYLYCIQGIELFNAWGYLLDLFTLLAHLIIQAYFLLLVRSELIKLMNNCQFTFVNNAAEAACALKLEGVTFDEEKGTEDIR